MKTKSFALSVLVLTGLLSVLSVARVSADGPPSAGKLGVGLVLGSPTGITAKYWLSQTSAFDVAVGFGDLTLQADYLWHSWTLFPAPSQGAIAGYMGLGGRYEDDDDDHHYHNHDNGDRHRHDHDAEFGIRVPIGVTYIFPRHPFDVFLEVAPVLEFGEHDTDLDLDAGIGGRIYFGRGR